MTALTSRCDDLETIARLAALDVCRVPDPRAPSGFDDIVQLAAQLCGTPLALVSLLDRHPPRVEARVGLGSAALSQWVSSHALDNAGLLVIPDLAADVRTRTDPSVTGSPHLRFYAGIGLTTAEGLRLGTLCVADDAPRPAGLEPGQRVGLEALGRQAMVQFDLRRALDAGSQPSLVGSAPDVSARKAGEVAAAAAHRRQRLALQAALIGLWDYDPVSDMVHYDDLCRAMFGLPAGGALTLERFLGAIHRDDRAAAAVALAQALDPAGSGEFSIAYRIRGGRSGAERWIAACGHVTADDRPAHLMGVARDITRQKHAEARQAALIELGDALRDLDRTRDIAWTAARIMGRALGVDRVGYGTVDAVQQTIEILQDWTAPGVASVAGSHRFATAGTALDVLELGRPVAVPDAAELPSTFAGAGTFGGRGTRAMLTVPILEHGRLVGLVFLHHGERRAWSDEEIGFVRNAGDRVRAAVARLQAEEEQRLVNRELGHRLKNTLAMVQAIASQTLRNAPTLELARDALSARLVALGRAHDILLGGGEDRAALRSLVTGSLALAGDLQANRFTITGPDLVIGPKAALSVSLMIHELATNAAKYGALSRPEGGVDIFWRVEARDGREMFHLGWSEHGGPPVATPARRGFGTRLIEGGLAGAVGGAMALRYPPEGVRCTLDAPLGAMMAPA